MNDDKFFDELKRTSAIARAADRKNEADTKVSAEKPGDEAHDKDVKAEGKPADGKPADSGGETRAGDGSDGDGEAADSGSKTPDGDDTPDGDEPSGGGEPHDDTTEGDSDSPDADEKSPGGDRANRRDSKKKGRKYKYSKKLIVLYALLGIFIAAVIVCAVGLVVELYTSRKSINYYSALSEEVERRPRPEWTPVYVSPSAPSPTQAPDAPETPGTPDGQANNAGQSNPDQSDTAGRVWEPYVDFDELSERFPGIVAWIQLNGTLLDYPVMIGNDNAFYLSHLPDGTYDRAGSVFLDYRNSIDFTDRNSLIYGHMSRVGEMFGALKEYRNQSFYNSHPYINLYTRHADYRIIVFAGYLVDSGVETPPMSFADDAAFNNYLANLRRRNLFTSNVQVSSSDRLVCLCTCAYDFTNARLVIVGKLVEAVWDASTNMTTQ